MSNNENNKEKGFSQGIILIIIGVIFTMVTLFDFDINWYVVAKMWPLLLIIIGVCIMPINKWVRTVIALVLLALGCVLYHQKADDTCCKNKVEIITRSHRGVFWDDDEIDDD